jgi:hypothetical protein
MGQFEIQSAIRFFTVGESNFDAFSCSHGITRAENSRNRIKFESIAADGGGCNWALRG